MTREQSADDPRRGKKVTRGALSGHYKEGGIFRPSLLAYPNTALKDWIVEDFPDLLWPAVLVETYGDDGVRAIAAAQRVLLDIMTPSSASVRLDGRLTSLEDFPAELRDAFLDAIEDLNQTTRLVPPELYQILTMFDDVPGLWLVQGAVGEHNEDVDSKELLTDILVRAMKDHSFNASVKAGAFGWSVVARAVEFPTEWTELWPEYLNTDTRERSMAEATIRSSFLAVKAAEDQRDASRNEKVHAWSDSFWRQNWRNTECMLGRSPFASTVESAAATAERDEVVDTPDESADAVDTAIDGIDRLFALFVDYALDADMVDFTPARPAKHEVLVGLTTWTYRAVRQLLSSPDSLSAENNYHVIRGCFEREVYAHYMLLHEQDSNDPFEKYKRYGLGKVKLQNALREQLVAELGDAAPDYLIESVAEARRQGHGDWSGEFQEVSVETTFSGLSLWKMADEVGMIDGYKYMYQANSSLAHGEWGVLEYYALQKCRNPLHLFHRVPVFGNQVESPPDTIDYLVSRVEEMANIALGALLTDAARTQLSETGGADETD